VKLAVMTVEVRVATRVDWTVARRVLKRAATTVD
jgi:hypothetical protein